MLMKLFLRFVCAATVCLTIAGAEMTKTSSGLGIEDLKRGEGREAVSGKTVTVHYTGWLDNGGEKGDKFDSSLDRNTPFKFSLGAGQVIKGWDEGVAGMKEGGKRVLHIPSALGYGARGAGSVIPPNANLIFEVELIDAG
jgi:FKBP-type peptidyl-prolyl cis-trans isomerase